MDHTDLRIEINTVLMEAASAMVDGTTEAVGSLVEELSADIINAAANDDEELEDVTTARLLLLGERLRVKATNEMWDAITRISSALFKIAREAIL